MNKKLLIGLFVAIQINLTGQSQYNFLPDLEGWNKPTDTTTYYSYNLWDLINGAADSYIFYGFKELFLGNYTHENGTTIKVELYQHKNADNAYGIFSLERSPETHSLKAGAEGYWYENICNFVVDDYYVKLSSHTKGDEIEEAIHALAKSISHKINPEPQLPKVLSYFPSDNIKRRSKLYSAQAFLGIEFLHSAFTAEYYSKAVGDYGLFIIDPGSSTEALNMISKYKSFCKFEGNLDKNIVYQFNDPYNGTIFITHSGSYIIGTQQLDNADFAKDYINKVLENIKNTNQ